MVKFNITNIEAFSKFYEANNGKTGIFYSFLIFIEESDNKPNYIERVKFYQTFKILLSEFDLADITHRKGYECGQATFSVFKLEFRFPHSIPYDDEKSIYPVIKVLNEYLTTDGFLIFLEKCADLVDWNENKWEDEFAKKVIKIAMDLLSDEEKLFFKGKYEL